MNKQRRFLPDTSFEDLPPAARELFDILIHQTRFLNAFEYILKAREYDQERDKEKAKTWKTDKKRKRQAAELSVPEGYVCVSKFWLSLAEYYQAKYFFDEAILDLYLRTFNDNSTAERGAGLTEC